MGDILVFEVKSYKGEYTVDFCNFIPTVSNEGDVFVIDDNIYDHSSYYRDHYVENNEVYIVEATEEAKTLEGSQKLINFLIKNNFKRNNKIVAVGGGVVQDLVAFTSSVLYRGVDWVFYPTTLLAQCDSCIGSKTSINYNGFKNLLGGFHPPSFIYINPDFLKTLPEEEIKSGVGEMLHYFLLNHRIDISNKMVNDTNLMDNINEYVSESLSIKKKMIEKDEFDKGERNLFNYGHTFGHAIESITNYEINHGQAATIGMSVANKISLNRGMISQSVYDEMEQILSKNKPDYRIENIPEYMNALKRDKKNTSDKLTCILLNETYGEKTQISYDEVKDVL